MSYTSQTPTTAEKAQARSNIGAAPDGYGLGGTAVRLTPTDNLDTLMKNGWFDYNRDNAPQGSLPSALITYATLIRVSVAGSTCVQEAFDPTDSDNHGCVLRRTIYGTKVYPWEYVNPPMIIGREYRTTERYNYYVVYKRITSDGVMQWSIDDGATWKPECDFIGAASAADMAKKPDAVQFYTVLHVSKTGSDETGDGSESNPFLTIQKAINSLPRLLVNRVVIRVHEGTYDENVVISEFVGKEIRVEGASNESVSINTLNCLNCNIAYLNLNNLTIAGNSGDGYNWSIKLDNLTHAYLYNVTCTSETPTSNVGAFYISYTTMAIMNNCTISNKSIALDVMASTVYLNSTDTGTNNTVGIRCGSGWGNAGGYVQKGGATIAGEEQKGCGGQIW